MVFIKYKGEMMNKQQRVIINNSFGLMNGFGDGNNDDFDIVIERLKTLKVSPKQYVHYLLNGKDFYQLFRADETRRFIKYLYDNGIIDIRRDARMLLVCDMLTFSDWLLANNSQSHDAYERVKLMTDIGMTVELKHTHGVDTCIHPYILDDIEKLKWVYKHHKYIFTNRFIVKNVEYCGKTKKYIAAKFLITKLKHCQYDLSGIPREHIVMMCKDKKWFEYLHPNIKLLLI